MRYMMLVKANKDTEAGVMPTTEQLAAMGKLNEEMLAAGVLRAGDGLHPTSRGMRIKFEQGRRTLRRGPFLHTEELLAGFWIIEVKSEEEALEWAAKIPFTDGEEVEIRKIYEASDFPADVFPPEAAAREEEMRRELERRGTGR